MPSDTESTRIGTLPEPLGDMPAVDWEENLLVFGGACGQQVRDTVWSISPESGKCREAFRMPYASRGHQAVAVAGQVYLLGGFSQGTHDDFHRLDLKTGRAEALRPLPHDLAWFGAAVLEGRIWILGGYSIPGGYLDSAQVYDPETDHWEVVPRTFDQSPFRHGLLGSNCLLSHQGALLSFGGADEFDHSSKRCNALNTVARFDPGSSAWEALDIEILPRADHAAAAHDGKVYLTGGSGSDYRNVAEIEEVDLNRQTCSLLACCLEARNAPGLGVAGNRLVVAGGATTSLFNMTDSIEAVSIED